MHSRRPRRRATEKFGTGLWPGASRTIPEGLWARQALPARALGSRSSRAAYFLRVSVSEQKKHPGKKPPKPPKVPRHRFSFLFWSRACPRCNPEVTDQGARAPREKWAGTPLYSGTATLSTGRWSHPNRLPMLQHTPIPDHNDLFVICSSLTLQCAMLSCRNLGRFFDCRVDLCFPSHAPVLHGFLHRKKRQRCGKVAEV